MMQEPLNTRKKNVFLYQADPGPEFATFVRDLHRLGYTPLAEDTTTLDFMKELNVGAKSLSDFFAGTRGGYSQLVESLTKPVLDPETLYIDLLVVDHIDHSCSVNYNIEGSRSPVRISISKMVKLAYIGNRPVFVNPDKDDYKWFIDKSVNVHGFRPNDITWTHTHAAFVLGHTEACDFLKKIRSRVSRKLAELTDPAQK